MSYIAAISTAVPAQRIEQRNVAEFMCRALGMDEAESRKLRALYRASGIESRYTVLGDYATTPENFRFFPNNWSLSPFPGTAARMQVYRDHALDLAQRALEGCLADAGLTDRSSISHLITVSCTGMFAPGLDILLVERLGLPTGVQRTGINFMGCYAAFSAIKVADAICRAEPDARVLVVCVELCTLHFQQSTEDDHLLSGALFGDGAAALLMTGRKVHEGLHMSARQFANGLALHGQGDMAWHIGDFGFEMRLSSYVPDLIAEGIHELTQTLLGGLEVGLDDIDYFAIHPGGRKILEVIEKELGISREDNEPAYSVLRRYGNMSSPTVLFVLRELWQRLTPADTGRHILSFAFGPGLTLESMLLRAE